MGQDMDKAEALLEKEYKEGMDREECLRVALHIMDSLLGMAVGDSDGSSSSGSSSIDEKDSISRRLEVAFLMVDEKGKPRLVHVNDEDVENTRKQVIKGQSMAVASG